MKYVRSRRTFLLVARCSGVFVMINYNIYYLEMVWEFAGVHDMYNHTYVYDLSIFGQYMQIQANPCDMHKVSSNSSTEVDFKL